MFLITEDWFFLSHFLERALAAQADGFEIVVAGRDNGSADLIRREGIVFHTLPFDRRSMNLFSELHLLWRIVQLYAAEQPTIVHHLALKPILLGSIAARLNGIRRIVNAPLGMGYIFTSSDLRARFVRPLVWLAIRMVINPRGSKVIFENEEDLEELIGAKAVQKSDAVLIRGAGVDLSQFSPAPIPPGDPVVLVVSRMLYDKGIGDFVEAARLLRSQNVAGRFWLVGAPDAGNPSSISQSILEQWSAEGIIEWFKQRDDVPTLMRKASIVCLPSYREGMPKVLLEALAVGRAIVACDVIGCRELVTDGTDGFLVSPRNPLALAAAIRRLLEDSALCATFGAAGRQKAVRQFSSHTVSSATLAIYSGMLQASPPVTQHS